MNRCACLALLAALAPAHGEDAPGHKLDSARIEQLTGLKGAWNDAEGVFKVTSPRTDVKISVDGSPMAPFMSLTSWAAFEKGAKAEAMVMGDLVLFQDEVNPVMSAALDAGLQVTALHNHFFYDDPKAYFMHIGGEGATEAMATAVRKALDKVKEIRAATPVPASGFGARPLPTPSAVTPKPIEDALSVKGTVKDGMFKVVIGRKARASCGCEVGKEMGVNTWAAFAGNDEDAMVDGDFAVQEEELQPVLKSLRKSGINIVAIHSHMTGESPRILFLHYWGRGKAADLATSLKGALDLQGK